MAVLLDSSTCYRSCFEAQVQTPASTSKPSPCSSAQPGVHSRRNRRGTAVLTVRCHQTDSSHNGTAANSQQQGGWVGGLTAGFPEEQRGSVQRPRTTVERRVGTSAIALQPSKQQDVTSNAHRRHWPKKADLYLVRTDGMSCSRETVQASGCLSFEHPSTQQHLLVWKSRPRCVMILKKLGKDLHGEFMETLRYLGEEEGMRVLVEPHEYAQLDTRGLEYVSTFSEEECDRLHTYTDFVVCLGGDGVLLHASYLFKSAIPPVISFNLGSLGFLTNHEHRNFKDDLRGVIYGCESLGQCAMDSSMLGVHIILRMRLLCEIRRAGGATVERFEVLNEVVVDRGANPYLTKIECWENDRLITKVQADGVMLATPTGSTAYSVAAGGSMVHPNVPAILFTPVCPHSLSFRPVILPDYADLELRIPHDARSSAWVCFDGKQRQELQRGDAVRVRMSPNPVPTINKTDGSADWFASLERCFGWNDRKEQARE